MTDRRVSEDEHAWLIARERGERGPAVPEARARRYSEIGAMITGLPASPAGTADRPGWEQDVLAAIDAEAGRVAVAQRRRRAATLAACAAAAAALAIVVLVRRDVPRDDTPRAEAVRRDGSAGSPVVTRGEGRMTRQLVLRHSLDGRSATGAAPRELHDGDTVVEGDRMRASVITNQDATLYLAFCSRGQLRIYPSRQGLRARAGELTQVPPGGDLVFDANPGSEALYLIVSRDELATADAQLAELIAAADAGTAVDCASLDRRLAAAPSAPAATTVLRGAAGTADGQPIVAADRAGIVAVRYRFTHIAAGEGHGP